MKLKNWYKLLLVFGLVLAFFKAEAHPYHVSIAEIKYNAKTQKLEVALKLYTDDLEKTLSEMAVKPVLVNQSPEVQKQLEVYLNNNFRVELPQNQGLAQKFIGFEKQGDAHWLYLEIPLKQNQLEQARLRNQVLIKTFPDQTNMTNLEINGKKRTIIFKEGEVLQTLL